MTPNPIHKVLSTMRLHRVQCLLMGGQACVLYGAAEFSRATDLALLSEAENLTRLQPTNQSWLHSLTWRRSANASWIAFTGFLSSRSGNDSVTPEAVFATEICDGRSRGALFLHRP